MADSFTGASGCIARFVARSSVIPDRRARSVILAEERPLAFPSS
jgi:hypothetical protein